MYWRRYRTWAATVHWYAVAAYAVALIGVVGTWLRPTTSLGQVVAIGVFALVLSVLSLREE